MISWREFKKDALYKRYGTKKKYVDKIFSFDIETTSYFIYNGRIYSQKEYNPEVYADKDIEYGSCMYIWQLGIDDTVYFGRTWEELKEFFDIIEAAYPEKKIFFIHNLAFEFQFLRTVFEIDKVFARSQRKPIYCTLADYNIEMRCTYFMSNNALAALPKMYDLPVEKLSGDLDYSKIRHPETPLTEEELAYCEHDILVVYWYIKHLLEIYPNTNKIPKTNTGQVRRELQTVTEKDWKYKKYVRQAINTDPHVYNMLLDAFAGGYTHANYRYADLILENVDSWDISSSYPFVLCTERYPGSEFKRCYIKDPADMISSFAYLLRVKFKGLKTKFQNNIISYSHCTNIIDGFYDNGRIIKAGELEMVCTDVDLKLFCSAYDYESCEILESYYAIYKYLHPTFIKFVLDKYVLKTTLKGVAGKETEYTKEKNRFNSLYGMSVTNTIRNEVEYNSAWEERALTNEEIENKLWADKKKAFLSFAYGVWVTAWARKNLFDVLLALDKFVAYADTDSLKLLPGYDKTVIEDYNRRAIEKTRSVCKKLGLEFRQFAPADIKGRKRQMGIYDYEGRYDLFKTLGAKKYCTETDKAINITVAGVPKTGAACLSDIRDFKKGLIFDAETTGKNSLFYNDYQSAHKLTDYKGNIYNIKDRSGCCILPANYTLGVTEEYEELFGSERARYRENEIS